MKKIQNLIVTIIVMVFLPAMSKTASFEYQQRESQWDQSSSSHQTDNIAKQPYIPTSQPFIPHADHVQIAVQKPTTQNPFEQYDTQSSEEWFDPMKQPDQAYQDFLRSNSQIYSSPSLDAGTSTSTATIPEQQQITQLPLSSINPSAYEQKLNLKQQSSAALISEISDEEQHENDKEFLRQIYLHENVKPSSQPLNTIINSVVNNKNHINLEYSGSKNVGIQSVEVVDNDNADKDNNNNNDDDGAYDMEEQNTQKMSGTILPPPLLNDIVLTKELEETDNTSNPKQPLPYTAELTSNKHPKMFVLPTVLVDHPQQEDPIPLVAAAAQVPTLQVHNENSLQIPSLGMAAAVAVSSSESDEEQYIHLNDTHDINHKNYDVVDENVDIENNNNNFKYDSIDVESGGSVGEDNSNGGYTTTFADAYLIPTITTNRPQQQPPTNVLLTTYDETTTTLSPIPQQLEPELSAAAAAAAATITTTTTTTTTTTRTTGVVAAAGTSTTTTITHRKSTKKTASPRIYKYSADEILRRLLDDSYIRAPMAALIDTSTGALGKTKMLWEAALRSQAAMDIILIAFNSTGVGVTYSFKNTRTMVAGIDSVQESDESSGKAFYGIMRASELIPYDSAIFLSTDKIPSDTNLANYAAITLLKKRIRLYLIWFGPHQNDDNETLGVSTDGGLLGKVALRSGGEIIRVSEEAMGPNGDFGLITLFFQNDIEGAQELAIPIDTTVSNLLLKFHGNIDTATLETPTTVGGDTFIDLLNENSVKSFSFGSSSIQYNTDDGKTLPSLGHSPKIMNNNEFIIRLNVSTANNCQNNIGIRGGDGVVVDDHSWGGGGGGGVGDNGHSPPCIYRLKTTGYGQYSYIVKMELNKFKNDNENDENVLIELSNRNNEISDENSWTFFEENKNEPRSERLIQFNNEEDPTTLFENVEMSKENFRFPYETNKIGNDNNSTELVGSGEDDDDNDEKALMERNTLQAVTKIELGIQSQLLASPGTTVQIYYEVTNLREESTFHNFQVVDEKRFLRTLSPLSMWLTAGQSTTAVVTAYIPPNTEIGAKDKITFTSQGLGLASQAATLTVTSNSGIQDTRQPNLYWAYGSRCDYKTGPGQCASAVWSLEVTAQDPDTGILRIQSRPAGITIRNAFTAGTNNEVKSTYTASCCSTRVTITAFDLAGNQRAVTLDVTDIVLNEATIAAIAVGVILLLVLLIIFIVFIVWCCRKRKESRELETYRARAAASSGGGGTNDRSRSS